jgi:hypothetical protein
LHQTVCCGYFVGETKTIGSKNEKYIDPVDTSLIAGVALRLPSPLVRSVVRIVGGHLRSISVVMALSLTLSVSLLAQVAHVAVCQPASPPATSNDASLMTRFVAELGDATKVASLKAIRYTTAISAGTDANPVKGEVTQTRVYPDHLLMVTRILGGTSYLEASPAGAFVQPSGGSKTTLPEAMRDELLKTVRLDRFYVGQNIGSSKITVTDTGTQRIGNVEAAALHLNVEGARGNMVRRSGEWNTVTDSREGPRYGRYGGFNCGLFGLEKLRWPYDFLSASHHAGWQVKSGEGSHCGIEPGHIED